MSRVLYHMYCIALSDYLELTNLVTNNVLCKLVNGAGQSLSFFCDSLIECIHSQGAIHCPIIE